MWIFRSETVVDGPILRVCPPLREDLQVYGEAYDGVLESFGRKSKPWPQKIFVKLPGHLEEATFQIPLRMLRLAVRQEPAQAAPQSQQAIAERSL
jgi:hypothetical protein